MKKVFKQDNYLEFDEKRLDEYVERMLDGLDLDKEILIRNVMSKLKRDELQASEIIRAVYMSCVELISKEEPNWTFAAARAYNTKLQKEAARNRGEKSTRDNPYPNFKNLIDQLTDKGIYHARLKEVYTEDEINYLGKVINPENDKLLTYIGLITLDERYLTGDYDKSTYELVQERWMVIAMYIMQNEPKETRLDLVQEAYWAVSGLYMTTATPTLSNSGKAKGGQLSSCFIDTIDDSLRGIYDSNTDIAMLSKMGGGIGIFAGNVRAEGSDIRGYKNISAGIIPWIKQLNNTGVSVDQLGTRKGSIAVYLQDWHKDIFSFLDLKLNNGDERRRAHDIFQGFVASDLFMEKVEAREKWYLFCPHEVRTIMGFDLNDCFDEERGKGTFRTRYEECVNHPLLPRREVEAIDIMKRLLKSQLETGTPYMTYKDTVNRANPNKAHGIIYCSNLCVEIQQNQSPTTVVQEKLVKAHGLGLPGISDDEEVIVTYKKPGEFVVCNLSSTNLAKAVTEDVLERLIPIQIRMLDNVIDINNIDVLQAQHTNKQYRAIGYGTFGFHHLLALKKLRWESEEAVDYNDKLYEHIAYLVIQSSMELAKEKGAYPLFEGSEWHNSNFFVDRGLVGRDENGELFPIENYERWYDLAIQVRDNGLRNGYLFAIAPNGSTSIIAGSTASIDPVYGILSYEEKTTYKIANPAPDLSPATMWFYKSAFEIDQHWSIKHTARRQRYIDQSQSFNLYVKPDIKAKDFLALHLDAWKSGVKTTYYVRNQAKEMPEDCVVCQ